MCGFLLEREINRSEVERSLFYRIKSDFYSSVEENCWKGKLSIYLYVNNSFLLIRPKSLQESINIT